MPLRFWDEAFYTLVHIINRLSTPISSNKNPFEFMGLNLIINSLKLFDAHVIFNTGLTTTINLISKHNHALLLVMVTCIRGVNV